MVRFRLARRCAIRLLAAAAATTLSGVLPAEAAVPTVSVSAHGATGGDKTDDYKALVRAFAAAASRGAVVEFPAGTFHVNHAVTIPPGVTSVRLHPQTIIRQTGNQSVFIRRGEAAAQPVAVVSGTTAGSTSIRTRTALTAGSWVLLGSDDVVMPARGWKQGVLRQVVQVSGTTAVLDRPLHSTMTKAPKAWPLRLAPSLRIEGGILEQANPLAVREPMVRFELASNPQLIGTDIRNCGGSGVLLLGTVGGEVRADVHDCVDDHSGARFGGGRHYGYGVEVSGPSRDLFVGGTAARVRHGFTTSGGELFANRALRPIGEPEGVEVSMLVVDASSTGIDTHAIGTNIVFRNSVVLNAGTYRRAGSTDGNEGGNAYFIRARSVQILGGLVNGSADSGILVSAPPDGVARWSGAHRTIIRGVTIADSGGLRGIHLKQAAIVDGVHISGRHQIGIQVDKGVTGEELTALDIRLDTQKPILVHR